MKNIFIFSFLLFAFIVSNNLFAQVQGELEPRIHVDSIYKDISINLLREEIIVLDSARDQNEIMDAYRAWIGLSFRSAEAVTTSETQNQIVLDYIGGPGIYTVKRYYRITAQFKANKIRLRIYDAGNCGYYSSYGRYSMSIQPREYNIKEFMNYIRAITWIKYSDKENYLTFRGIEFYNELKIELNNVIIDIKNNLNNPQSNNDW